MIWITMARSQDRERNGGRRPGCRWIECMKGMVRYDEHHFGRRSAFAMQAYFTSFLLGEMI